MKNITDAFQQHNASSVGNYEGYGNFDVVIDFYDVNVTGFVKHKFMS